MSVELDDIVRWFESMTPTSVSQAPKFYTASAIFKDPFNEVTGASAIERIYAHMFEQVVDPRFKVTARFVGSDGVVLAWTMSFRFAPGKPEQSILGVTHLEFDVDGRIRHHRDYWDPAEALYAKIPVLGALMRVLRRRLRAPQPGGISSSA